MISPYSVASCGDVRLRSVLQHRLEREREQRRDDERQQRELRDMLTQDDDRRDDVRARSAPYASPAR